MRYAKEGDFFRLEIVNAEDLWYLSLLLRPGDVVKADVFRRVENREDLVRRKKTERERVTVSVRVESIEFSELLMNLHVLGEIVQGPEEYVGEHQSINLEVGSFIFVIPSDPDSFVKVLQESASLSYGRVAVLSVDEKGVSLYYVDESRNELAWRIQTSQGKMFDMEENDSYSELRTRLERLKGERIYLIGPQVLRGRVTRVLKDSRVNVESTEIGESGEEGVRALLSSGALEMRRSTEMSLVNEFLRGINSGLSAYGREKVFIALNSGAVETLVITDRYFRENNAFPLLETCRGKGCRVFIVHSSWETGKIIGSYGGIVGILRYRIEEWSSAGE
ncbi:MAG: hypothetical protein ACP5UO_02240 [Thermoplasmata archaeon]